MKKLLLTIVIIFFSNTQYAQEHIFLQGQVLYLHTPVEGAHVINTTSNQANITNTEGFFSIMVKEGDRLVFSIINYEIVETIITKEILTKKRLVVEVKERVTALDEVVVTPYNQEAFIKLQGEQFKSNLHYTPDYSTKVQNLALSQSEQGLQYGLNINNILKLIFNSIFKKEEKEKINKLQLKPSEVFRTLYSDDFFIDNLKIPQKNIGEFLLYCDYVLTDESLLKKDAEFQRLEFLVQQSTIYLEILNGK